MQNTFKQTFFLLSWLLLISQLSAQAPEIATSSTDSTHPSRPAYLILSAGVQPSTFRDFATSPLFYSGNPLAFALSHTDQDTKRESSIRLSYAFGNFTNAPEQGGATSKLDILALNYVELFQLPEFNWAKLNLKVGGQFNSTVNLRDNEALGNNSDGFEVISTLFGSAKVSRDLSGKRGERKHQISFGLHLGLLNSSYRNGFIYTRQSPLLNRDEINEGYQLRFFSGYRINSSLDYMTWLKNGNALRLAYVWDLYRTGGGQDEFEMASHLLQLSLLFSLKK